MGFARIMGGGRGNLRVAKTPPLQAALRGDRCGYAAPIAICAHGGINGNGEWEDHDAALVREGTRVARHLPYQEP